MTACGVRYVRFYPSDWRSGCIGLSPEEEGVYMRVCAHAWETGQRLPLDDGAAASRLMLDVRMWRRLKTRLIEKGKLHVAENGLYNPRAERELTAALGAKGEAAPANVGTARGSDDHQPEDRRDQVGGRRAARPELLADVADKSPESLPEVAGNFAKNGNEINAPNRTITRTITRKEDSPPSPPGAEPIDLLRSAAKPKREACGSRLDRDWVLPDGWRQWTRTTFPQSTAASVDEQAATFRDYWVGVAGQKARKADWEATWRNWCRKAFATGPLRPHAQPPPAVSRNAAIRALLNVEGRA